GDSFSSNRWLGENGAPGPIWYSGVPAVVGDGQTYLNGVPVNGKATPRPRTLSVMSLVLTGNNSADQFGRDVNGNFPWWGDLAELAIYDRRLSDVERKAVEDYFRIKYWNVTATPGVDSVSLAWTTRPSAARYDVERSTTSGTGYANVATGLLGTAYTDTSVASQTTYFYRIVAVDSSGNRLPSREVVSSSVYVGSGSGLTGAYYNNADLAGSPALVQVDPVVDFNFA